MLTKAELKRIQSLQDRKTREALGVFVVEGEKVVNELLAAKFPLVEIYATHEWAEATKKAQPRLTEDGSPYPRTIEISGDDMTRLSHFPTPSRVVAIGKIVRPPLEAAELGRGLTLALDAVQDAGNVGTVLRIADWFGVDRVVLSPECADLFHQKVINASMGSFARVHTHTAELPDLFHELAASVPTIPIIGCDLAGDDVHSIQGLRDAVIVIGSEGRGISEAVANLLTRRVTIPRYGKAESLNAAIAAGIVCDNVRRLPIVLG